MPNQNEKGHWYTDKNGNHYFVEEGQSPKEGWEASKRRKMISGGKYQVDDGDGKGPRDVNKDEYDKYEADQADFDATTDDDFGFDESPMEDVSKTATADYKKYPDMVSPDGSWNGLLSKDFIVDHSSLSPRKAAAVSKYLLVGGGADYYDSPEDLLKSGKLEDVYEYYRDFMEQDEIYDLAEQMLPPRKEQDADGDFASFEYDAYFDRPVGQIFTSMAKDYTGQMRSILSRIPGYSDMSAGTTEDVISKLTDPGLDREAAENIIRNSIPDYDRMPDAGKNSIITGIIRRNKLMSRRGGAKKATDIPGTSEEPAGVAKASGSDEKGAYARLMDYLKKHGYTDAGVAISLNTDALKKEFPELDEDLIDSVMAMREYDHYPSYEDASSRRISMNHRRMKDLMDAEVNKSPDREWTEDELYDVIRGNQGKYSIPFSDDDFRHHAKEYLNRHEWKKKNGLLKVPDVGEVKGEWVKGDGSDERHLRIKSGPFAGDYDNWDDFWSTVRAGRK